MRANGRIYVLGREYVYRRCLGCGERVLTAVGQQHGMCNECFPDRTRDEDRLRFGDSYGRHWHSRKKSLGAA